MNIYSSAAKKSPERRESGPVSKPTIYVLRLHEVRCRVGLSRSSIYAMIAVGAFPPPIQLGLRAVGWPEHVIDAWLAERMSRADLRFKRGAA